MSTTKRMQVLVPAAQYRVYKRVAQLHDASVGEWVRRTLDEAVRRVPKRSVAQKLAALDRAMKYSFPAPDIDQMNAEIEQGYLSGEWPR